MLSEEGKQCLAFKETACQEISSQPTALGPGRNWRRALLEATPLVFLGASTAVRLITGFGLLKYLAVQFDPGTFGLLTQIMGVAAVFYMFAGGGITNGLIRNISAESQLEVRRHWMWAGTTLTAASSIALALIAASLALLDGSAIFGDPSYGWVYIAIAVAQVVVGIGNLLCANFSGNRDYRTFAKVQIVGNFLSLLLLIALAQSLGLVGAVLGVVLAPAMTGVVALTEFLRQPGNRHMLRLAWEPAFLKSLLTYAGAMACAVTAVPLAQLLIRLDMSERLGWNVVGYWQAVAKLSDAYMLFVGVVFIHYLLPKLSAQKTESGALPALIRLGTPIFFTFILAGGAIYLVRDYLILIVYSDQFLPASEFVLPQLVGDTLRVAALIPHYYLMSRGRVVVTIVNEVTPAIATFLLYLLLIPHVGAVAAVYAHVGSGMLLILMALVALHLTLNK